MIILYLLPIIALIIIAISYHFVKFLSLFNKKNEAIIISLPLTIIITFVFISPLIAYIVPNYTVKSILKQISNISLGLFLIIVVLSFIFSIFIFIIKKTKHVILIKHYKIYGIILIISIFLMAIFGNINARTIKITNYNVDVNKEINLSKNTLKIALISDLHIGYNLGLNKITDMVKKINSLNPDLVIISGDIFDNDYNAIKDPDLIENELRNLKSTYGTFACLGNHDVYENLLVGFSYKNQNFPKVIDSNMINFLKAANITVLEDDYLLIDDAFYLYGRKDARLNKDRKNANELTKNLDITKPIILIDHEPKELDELSTTGIDLDLSGHTHNGQIFPGNIITALMWENSYGKTIKNNMTSIVTSGVGAFGPYMRIGTSAEICNITVNFI